MMTVNQTSDFNHHKLGATPAGGFRVGLALAIALDVGGMCGNGMCQMRGRESLPVAVRWEVRLLIWSIGLFSVPRFLILY